MMKRDMLRSDLTRRGILKGTGALVISFTASATLAQAATAATAAPKPLDPAQLDSYLAIHTDSFSHDFLRQDRWRPGHRCRHRADRRRRA